MNLATKNKGDFTITESGESFISQRKLADLIGAKGDAVRKHISRHHKNVNTINGLDENTAFLVTTYFAYESKASTQEARDFIKRIGAAGIRAFNYHEAGYVVEAKKPEADKPTPSAINLESLHPLQIANLALDTAERWGFTGNQALLSADKATKALTGQSPLTLMGHTHLTNEKQEQSFTPTELGSMLPEPISARSFNLLLERNGMQVKEGKHWIPTAQGESFAHVLDTNKKHSDGTPIQQIKWYKSVLDNLTNQ